MQPVLYDTSILRSFLESHNLTAMHLVRLTGISVSSAYKIINGGNVKDLDVLYRIYKGLRNSGYTVTWKDITGIE